MEFIRIEDIGGPKGLVVIKPQIFDDPRGYFYESYNYFKFMENGIPDTFLQDNQSLSCRGTVRGLHFQNPPYGQGKLVRVIRGSVKDVVVDIRVGSPTYGGVFNIELSDKNKYMFWIPIGFAHGFSTLEDDTIFTYKCTNVYNVSSKGGILWNDKDLGIDWQVSDPVVSDEDKKHELFKDFNSPFKY